MHRTLYLRILEHLGKGQAYETAIELVRELEVEYERTFNYPRLAELLNLKAELFAHIARTDRQFGCARRASLLLLFLLGESLLTLSCLPRRAFFRVAFFGSRWPSSISGKQFIYRGQSGETLGAFLERMMSKHPTCVPPLPTVPFIQR